MIAAMLLNIKVINNRTVIIAYPTFWDCFSVLRWWFCWERSLKRWNFDTVPIEVYIYLKFIIILWYLVSIKKIWIGVNLTQIFTLFLLSFTGLTNEKTYIFIFIYFSFIVICSNFQITRCSSFIDLKYLCCHIPIPIN